MKAQIQHDPRVFFFITKTCLYNFDPLKPHFYIVKLGLKGYTLIFLFLLKNKDYGYLLEPPLYFEQEYEKYQNFLSENFPFLVVKFSIYLNRHVFIMVVVVCLFVFSVPNSKFYR